MSRAATDSLGSDVWKLFDPASSSAWPEFFDKAHEFLRQRHHWCCQYGDVLQTFFELYQFHTEETMIRLLSTLARQLNVCAKCVRCYRELQQRWICQAQLEADCNIADDIVNRSDLIRKREHILREVNGRMIVQSLNVLAVENPDTACTAIYQALIEPSLLLLDPVMSALERAFVVRSSSRDQRQSAWLALDMPSIGLEALYETVGMFLISGFQVSPLQQWAYNQVRIGVVYIFELFAL